MDKGWPMEIRAMILSPGKTAEALDGYSEAVRLSRESPRVYNGRGLVYEKMGSRPLALADYRKATSLEARNAEQRKARLHAHERVIALEAELAAAEAARKKNEGKPADPGMRIAL
jgi:tetratricopeptide (TPR) repeat protein